MQDFLYKVRFLPQYTKNVANLGHEFFAGEKGIEPLLEVLETPVLPLYDSPIYINTD